MRYVRRDLRPQEIQDLSNRVELQDLAPSEGSAEGPHVTYASTVPAGRNARGSVSVFIEQAQVPGGDSGLKRFSISIAGCGVEERCSVIRSRAERASQEVVHQRMPLDGAGISAVLFGDANRDGLTDVLVRFSDGSGSLYQAQMPAARRATQRPAAHEVPSLGNGGTPRPITSEAPSQTARTEEPSRPVPAAPVSSSERSLPLSVTLHSQAVTGAVVIDEEADDFTFMLMQGVYDLLYRSAGAY